MRKVLTLIVLICFFGIVKNASAQVQQVLILTRFENDGQMDFIFENTQRVLIYTEGGDIELPVILSLNTRSQIDVLENSGLEPTIIDSNPDVARYILLYNPKADQAEILNTYGETFVVSSYYTLLKLPIGQDFVHEGPASKFFIVPFVEEVVRPPKDIVVTPNLSLTPVDVAQPKSNAAFLTAVIGVLIVVAIIVGVFFGYKFIKQRRNTSQPQF